jgi:hypothetical protein
MKEFVRKVSVIVDFLPFPILNKNDNNVQMSNKKKCVLGISWRSTRSQRKVTKYQVVVKDKINLYLTIINGDTVPSAYRGTFVEVKFNEMNGYLNHCGVRIAAITAQFTRGHYSYQQLVFCTCRTKFLLSWWHEGTGSRRLRRPTPSESGRASRRQHVAPLPGRKRHRFRPHPVGKFAGRRLARMKKKKRESWTGSSA